jgi:predicted CopG family antitoxin
MWSDNETTEDLLGFKVHAELLLEVIKDDEVLPVSIGVFGDWGSGKSSILQMIYQKLLSENQDLKDGTLALYFNGWVFEGYDDAKAALLETILSEFEKNKKLWDEIAGEVTKLRKSVKWMRAIGLGFRKIVLPATAAYFTSGLSLIPYLASELQKLKPEEIAAQLQGQGAEDFIKSIVKEKEPEQESMVVREFREDFRDLIKKSKISKLVVIIDDLDRCTYERIIDNLEAIKLFLNVENTAFIIGADPRIVSHAIAHHYKVKLEDFSNESTARNQKLITDYLEKLIQIPYNLPRLSDHEVETYLSLLFCKREGKKSYSKVLEAFYDSRKKNRYTIFGLADMIPMLDATEKSVLEKSIGLIASLAPVITEGLNGNPRQIKRFMNTFLLRRKLADVANIKDIRVDILAKLMVLEYSFPDLFIELYQWQATSKGFAAKLAKIEKAASEGKPIIEEGINGFWKSDSMKKWLVIEPQLGVIDLSDYFWLSRDQLFSSISGSSLIPPHIRTLFKSLIEYSSEKILHSTIENEVIKESPQNMAFMYTLLEKELMTEPGKPELHKVFFALMGKKVENSFDSYKKAISKISDHEDINFSISIPLLSLIKTNPELEELKNIFKPDTKIDKALKRK